MMCNDEGAWVLTASGDVANVAGGAVAPGGGVK
jgi:hypothetical protein